MTEHSRESKCPDCNAVKKDDRYRLVIDGTSGGYCNHPWHDASESASQNPFEPEETREQQDARIGKMIRDNAEKRRSASPQPSPQPPTDAVEAEITHFIANFDCPCCGFPNCGHEHHSDTKKILKEALAKLKASEAVPSPQTATPREQRIKALVEAANNIRHWHDWGRENEGMVVSHDSVFALWKARDEFLKGEL